MEKETTNKNARGSSAQFFVAGELCRRDLVAVVTMGNTPNTDILCSNAQGTKFTHIQVKTFRPTDKTVAVGTKAERYYGENFIWVLAGIPIPNSSEDFVFYVVPSRDMSKNVAEQHKIWLETPGKNGQQHNESSMRTIQLPPRVAINGWSLEPYKNNWKIIEDLLR
jgi:hypothetical protein